MPDLPTIDRIAELEAELKERDDKIKRLTTDLDEAHDLVDRMRGQVEDCNRTIEQWIDVFEMQQNEHGSWPFDPTQSKLWDDHEEHEGLLREWNKFVRQYNAVIAPRPRGRPRAASAEQQKTILRLHKRKASQEAIAKDVGLSIRAVRTVIAGPQKTNALRRREFARLRAAFFRARKEEPGPAAATDGDRSAQGHV